MISARPERAFPCKTSVRRGNGLGKLCAVRSIDLNSTTPSFQTNQPYDDPNPLDLDRAAGSHGEPINRSTRRSSLHVGLMNLQFRLVVGWVHFLEESEFGQ